MEKMKKILVLFLLITSVLSCKKNSEVNSKANTIVQNDPYKEYYGNWVGDFVADEISDSLVDFSESNKINLVIKKIENGKAYGQSIVSGNSRPMMGEVKKVDNGLEFVLKEPGDEKYDGVFEFSIVGDKLMGMWYANDKNAKVISRKYELTKQEFKYNPNLMLPEERDYVDYYNVKKDTVTEEYEGETETYVNESYRFASDVITKMNGSTTAFKESDLKNLKKLELEIIRNTIYARHGYTFKKRSFRQFFDLVEWYIPISNDVTAELTSLEKENIKLLNRFEKYAEDNYDTFGR